MANIDKLIDEYVDVVIKKAYEDTEGDVKKANRIYDKVISLATKIKKIEGYAEKMKELLNHENDYVRLDVAFRLLPIYTAEAEDVLFELSQKRGDLGFTAEWTLKRWKNGELHKDKK